MIITKEVNVAQKDSMLSPQVLAERFGKLPALETPEGALSYFDLAQRITTLSDRIGKSHAPCALLATRTLDAFTVLCACLHLGRPILLISPSSPETLRKSLLQKVGATQCYSEEGWSDHCAPKSAEHPEPGDDVLIPTSGTTGDPKIVCLSKAALFASARGSIERLGLEKGDRWALTLPYSHVGGLSILIRCAQVGATVVIGDFRFEDERAVQRLEALKITHLSLVPTQLRRASSAASTPPHSLKVALVGGASCPPSLRQRAREAGWPLAFTYGMSEAASQVATQALGRTLAASPERDVGRPLSGTEIALDGAGRIAVRGPTMMNRYWGAPVRKPDEWFLTQDFGHWDDEDRLVIRGRADNMIISGGENVAAESVEESLTALPTVEEAVVFGVKDEIWGQRIVALLRGIPQDLETIREALRDQLEPYALPKEVWYVEELPRLASGKLDRKKARSLLPSSLNPPS